MERMITINGGGLAGLSLGIALRSRGLPVTLHEAGSYPRHRVCGEFISGVREDTLSDLGIADLFTDAQVHRTVSWFHDERPVFTGPLPEPALGISRHALDERLSRRFQRLGGVLCENSRQKPVPAEGSVWCAGRIPIKAGSWIGLKCHVENLPLASDLEMHLATNGYVGLSRIEGDRVNLCGLFRLDPARSGRGLETLAQYLRAGGLNTLWEKIKAARPLEDSFLGVAGFRLGWVPPREGFLALGDAVGMIPPFTGNGMSMAFESARESIEPLLQWHRGNTSWSATVQTVTESLKSRFRLRMLAARFMHPFLTARRGQGFLAAVSRSGLLPFELCFRVLR
jgi:menaquinone-9 beta-reductase